jgi:hypothetical protein
VQTLYSDIIGMTGTALVVLAYFLLQMERLDPKGLSYNLINLTGAGLLMVSLTYTFNLASFVIEIFWIAASLLGLWKWLGRRASH